MMQRTIIGLIIAYLLIYIIPMTFAGPRDYVQDPITTMTKGCYEMQLYSWADESPFYCKNITDKNLKNKCYEKSRKKRGGFVIFFYVSVVGSGFFSRFQEKSPNTIPAKNSANAPRNARKQSQ